ncbi:MAG: type II toxin-antitoxin system HicB family antitoxin [Bryobacteraceae bacterium]|jgi:antitoxin HicB
MLTYPAQFTPENGGFVVTFPDIPEAITEGDSEAEARDYAIDALETALSEYINRRREIPRARRVRGRGYRMVVVPALAEAKVRLYQAMRAGGVRKAELARRLGWHKSQVDRLLDLKHASRLDQIEQALGVLRKRLVIEIEDAA